MGISLSLLIRLGIASFLEPYIEDSFIHSIVIHASHPAPNVPPMLVYKGWATVEHGVFTNAQGPSETLSEESPFILTFCTQVVLLCEG